MATRRGERFDLIPAVYGMLRRDGQVLLLRRMATGYGDGRLSLPAGHVEPREDLVEALLREMREEVGITAERADCILSTVTHRAPEHPDDIECLDFYFTILRWSGEPRVMEPDLASEVAWVDSSSLPADTLEYIQLALKAAEFKISFLSIGWAK